MKVKKLLSLMLALLLVVAMFAGCGKTEPDENVLTGIYAPVHTAFGTADTMNATGIYPLEDGYTCLSAGLELLENPDEAIVTLREGKYHQIKRMLAARGKPVVYLKRLTMGPLRLDEELALGQWRELTGQEKQELGR